MRIAEGGICADRRRRICCGSQKADQLRIVECGPAADRICCGTQKTDLMRIAEGRSQKADQWRIAECRPVAVHRRRISCALRNADWLWGAEGGSAADHIADRRRRICLGSQKTGLLRIAEVRPVTDRRRRASCGSQKADLLRFFTGVYGYAERQLASHMRFQNRTRDMNETVNLIARNAHTKNQVI